MTVLLVIGGALAAILILVRFALRDVLARRTGTRIVTSVPSSERGERDDDR